MVSGPNPTEKSCLRIQGGNSLPLNRRKHEAPMPKHGPSHVDLNAKTGIVIQTVGAGAGGAALHYTEAIRWLPISITLHLLKRKWRLTPNQYLTPNFASIC